MTLSQVMNLMALLPAVNQAGCARDFIPTQISAKMWSCYLLTNSLIKKSFTPRYPSHTCIPHQLLWSSRIGHSSLNLVSWRTWKTWSLKFKPTIPHMGMSHASYPLHFSSLELHLTRQKAKAAQGETNKCTEVEQSIFLCNPSFPRATFSAGYEVSDWQHLTGACQIRETLAHAAALNQQPSSETLLTRGKRESSLLLKTSPSKEMHPGNYTMQTTSLHSWNIRSISTELGAKS